MLQSNIKALFTYEELRELKKRRKRNVIPKHIKAAICEKYIGEEMPIGELVEVFNITREQFHYVMSIYHGNDTLINKHFKSKVRT